MTTKLCCKCHKAPRSKGGYCDECNRIYQREYARRVRGSKPRPIKPVVPPGMKFCPKCERILAIERFSRSKGKSDGRMSHCKDCDYMKQLTYKEKNRARVRQLGRIYQRKWRAMHPGYNARACMRTKKKRIARKIEKAIEVQP